MIAKPKSIPTIPGVYIFRRQQVPLYIGKAANLRSRLASYFQKPAALPVKIQRMLAEADRLETIKTASEIEALLKEAELIKKHRPKYNLLMRDDKSYFYVVITREEFPRIFIAHQPRQETRNPKPETRNKSKIPSSKYIGPFTSGTTLYAVLKLLRRVFPYCTCKRPHKRPCVNSEMGRCPGYCCTIKLQSAKRKAQSARGEYRKNIRNIVAVLEGKRTRLVEALKRQMKEAVQRERFEEAAQLRDQIFGLEDVFRHRPVLRAPGSTLLTTDEERYAWPEVQAKLQALLKAGRTISRIEGYDISNIAGREATGSMVVFKDGQPDKSQYRKFRIKTVSGISDVDMLKEVLRRRLRHSEWPYPDLLLIDGGKAQLNAVCAAVPYNHDRQYNTTRREAGVPVVTALAKREETLFTDDGRAIQLMKQDPAILHLFQRIRDESHRFAQAYHHRLRAKAVLQREKTNRLQ